MTTVDKTTTPPTDGDQGIPPAAPPIDTSNFVPRDQYEQELERVKSDMRAEFEAQQQEFTNKLVTSITGEQRDPNEIPPWERDGRNATATELSQWTTQQTIKTLERQKSDELKAQQDRERQIMATSQDQAGQWKNTWQDQIKYLEQKNRIPAMPDDIRVKVAKNEQLTEEERQHPSVLAQNKIFSTMMEKGVYNVVELWDRHLEGNYKAQPPGADAPISMSRTSGGGDEDVSYDDLHKTPMHDLVRQLWGKN